MEMYNEHPCEKVWLFLKKLNISLPYDPTIPLLGIQPKELKIGAQLESLFFNTFNFGVISKLQKICQDVLFR